jgi:RNA polymerase sigma-70 factor (ECF subfamily)
VLGRVAEAQDAAQEALDRAWRRRHTCAEQDRPGPWVRAIARREALRIAGRRAEEPLEAAPEPPAPADEDLELARIAVRAVVAGLPRADRELLHATYWEDLAGAAVSLRSGHPAATVRVRLHRLRRALESPLGQALGLVG